LTNIKKISRAWLILLLKTARRKIRKEEKVPCVINKEVKRRNG